MAAVAGARLAHSSCSRTKQEIGSQDMGIGACDVRGLLLKHAMLLGFRNSRDFTRPTSSPAPRTDLVKFGLSHPRAECLETQSIGP